MENFKKIEDSDKDLFKKYMENFKKNRDNSSQASSEDLTTINLNPELIDTLSTNDICGKYTIAGISTWTLLTYSIAFIPKKYGGGGGDVGFKKGMLHEDSLSCMFWLSLWYGSILYYLEGRKVTKEKEDIESLKKDLNINSDSKSSSSLSKEGYLSKSSSSLSKEGDLSKSSS